MTAVIVIVGSIATAGAALAALSGGDSKRPRPTYAPPPPGRYKPEATEHNGRNLAAARGVVRAS